MRGLFVTGTDTEVGKTVVAAALLAALAARGESVAAFKPIVTGTDEPPGDKPADHELLAQCAGMAPEDVAPLRFGPPVSPHLAAELAGEPIDPRALAARARELGAERGTLIAEGVGGLLVPLTPDYLVRDLATELDLPVVIVARPGLGTINHTLLTVEAARSAGLEIAAVVLTPWPDEPSALQGSNRETIAHLARVEVAVLPQVDRFEPDALAAAGAGLPVRRWMA
ncbi:MAG: dethiobiotin synthase [Solirubrobacterales bacterium]|nr:dethiobiotin synthase [Solirubrobacterales bacterium]